MYKKEREVCIYIYIYTYKEREREYYPTALEAASREHLFLTKKTKDAERKKILQNTQD